MWSFTLSVFSYIRAKNGDSQSKSPNSVQMWEITNQKKFRVWTLSRSVILALSNTVTLNRHVTSIMTVFPSFFIYQIMSWLLSSNGQSVRMGKCCKWFQILIFQDIFHVLFILLLNHVEPKSFRHLVENIISPYFILLLYQLGTFTYDGYCYFLSFLPFLS